MVRIKICGENGGKILHHGELRVVESIKSERRLVVDIITFSSLYLPLVAVTYCHELCVLPIACHLANQFQFHLTKTSARTAHLLILLPHYVKADLNASHVS